MSRYAFSRLTIDIGQLALQRHVVSIADHLLSVGTASSRDDISQQDAAPTTVKTGSVVAGLGLIRIEIHPEFRVLSSMFRLN